MIRYRFFALNSWLYKLIAALVTVILVFSTCPNITTNVLAQTEQGTPDKVSPGPVDHIIIAPDTATITAGQSQPYTATAYDSDGKAWDVTAETTFSIDPGAGGSWSGSTYTSELAGTWTVTGTFDSLTDDATLTVEQVSPGPADHVIISPGTATVTASQSQSYTATAYDSEGKAWDVTAETTFSIDPGASGSWSGSTYTSELAGTWTVTGTFDSLTDDATLTVEQVSPGPADHVIISPGTATVTASQSQSYTATAYDSEGKAWDVTAETTFSIDPGASGSWSGSTYTSELAGTWTVTGTFDSLTDDATLTVEQVSPGPADHVIISPGTATVTASQSQSYTATAYDSEGKAWDVTAETTFSIDPGASGSWSGSTYTSELAGTWTVIGTYKSLTSSVLLTVESKDHQQLQEQPTEWATALVGPDEEVEIISNSGNVKLRIPKGAVSTKVEIGMSERVPWDSTGMKVVKLLEFNAKQVDNGEKVNRLNKDLEISIQNTPEELRGLDIDSLRLYYLDEDTKQWLPVESSKFDREKSVLTASINHFSYYGEQADPLINGPGRVMATEVNLHSGAATFSYPIELPPGPGGFQPKLALNYNSGSVDEMKNKRSTSSWVGIGWSYQFGKITRDLDNDQYYLELNGAAYKLFSTDDINYYTQPEQYFKITRSGNTWELLDREGFYYRFGGTTDSEQYLYCYGYYRWDLSLLRDTNGNQATVSYAQDTAHETVRAAYPEYLTYGNVQIHFISSWDENDPQEGHLRYDDPKTYLNYDAPRIMETRKLDAIEVKVSGSLIRKYTFAYTTTARVFSSDYGGIYYSGKHTLTSITQVGADGSSQLPATTFTYQDLQTYMNDTANSQYTGNPGNPASFNWPHLVEVDSGYGGTVSFSYTQIPDAAATSIDDLQVGASTDDCTVGSATETLRPNAAGDETALSKNGSGGSNYDRVDEEVADDATTYVYTTSTIYKRDLYNLPAHSVGSGTINFIKIYFRVAASSFYGAFAKPVQKSGSTVTEGTEVSTYLTSYTTYSEQWNTNPATGVAWTWDDIDALQIGVALHGPGTYSAYCTQVYVEVNYTYNPGDFNLTNVAEIAGYTTSTNSKSGSGMRFQNVTIPQGAPITTAYLTFTAAASDSLDNVNSVIIGEDTDNAATFSTIADYKARRGTIVGGSNNNNITSASVTWNAIGHWTAETTYNSPDISSIIQEIVNRSGWVSGSALVLFWDDHAGNSTPISSTHRQAYSYDGSTTKCAKLHIEYSSAFDIWTREVVTGKTIDGGIGSTQTYSYTYTDGPKYYLVGYKDSEYRGFGEVKETDAAGNYTRHWFYTTDTVNGKNAEKLTGREYQTNWYDSSNNLIQQKTYDWSWAATDQTATHKQKEPPTYMTGWSSRGGGTLNQPQGVAVSDDVYVYVADTGNSAIIKYTTDGTYVTSWSTWGGGNLNQPQGVAVSADGYVYVADTGNSAIRKYTTDGTYVTGWSTWEGGNLNQPQGVAVSDDGYVYVADTGNNAIRKYTTSGTYVASWYKWGTNNNDLNQPQGIAVSDDGYVYVADTGNYAIIKYTTDGTYVTSWFGWGGGNLNQPQGVAVSDDGYVYVADTGNWTMRKYTTDGTYVTSWSSGGDSSLNQPQGVAVSADGFAHVADTANNYIRKYLIFTNNWKVQLDQLDETTGDKTSRTRYLYDNYGNVITQYLDGDIATNTDDATIHRVFYPNTTANILSKPARERAYATITDDVGGANLKKETLYYYDGNNTSFTTPPTKGNLTRQEQKEDASSSVSSYYTYDSYGNMLTSQDANGNTTTWTYDTTHHTYPATKTYPITGLLESYTYDAGTNNLLSKTNVNGQTTNYEYDTFKRLTKADSSTQTLDLQVAASADDCRVSGWSTETLRPNAAGDETNIASQYPASNYHWDKVDEETTDDDSTYVYSNSTSYTRDLYSLSNPAGSGTINFIKVHYRFKRYSAGTGYLTPAIKTGGTVYEGSEDTETAGSYKDGSYQWTTNPKTGVAWTWNDLTNLQAGIKIKESPGGGHQTRCTQVYVEVNYTYHPWDFNLTHAAEIAGYTTSTNSKSGSGMRFQNVTIPQGAIITSAYLTFTAAASDSLDNVNSVIIGEDTNNASAFSDLANYQSRRGTIVGGANNNNITSASVTWNAIAHWTAETTYNSPDISAIIQEIVNRSGWTYGNALVLFWDDHAGNSTTINSTHRQAYSYDGSSSKAPKLHIECTMGGCIEYPYNQVAASADDCRVSGCSTEILSPNAAGDETNIASQYPASNYHWDKVDEATADDDSTYVYSNSTSYTRDLYNLSNPTGSGTINFIKVHYRFKRYSAGTGYLTPAIKTGGTVYEGSEDTETAGSYKDGSYQWTTNPKTGVAWTWNDLTNLQAGIKIKESPGGGHQTRCTQVYVEVNYVSTWDFNLTHTAEIAGYTSTTSGKSGSGMRFQNVTIPPGATITSAYLTFTASASDSLDNVNSVIIGEDTDNASAFSDLANYQSRRGTIVGGANNDNITSASVTWNAIGHWTAETTYNSPDISAIIQEIVNRSGWVSGNALVLFWDDYAGNSTQTTNTHRQAYSYDGSSSKAPKLHIEYTKESSIEYQYNNWGTLNQQHIKILTKIAESNDLWQSDYFDGLGRVVQTQANGETGRTIISSTTTYNNIGLVDKQYVSQDLDSSQVNGYKAPEAGWKYTSSAYDGLGRVITQTKADGTTISHDYSIPWQDKITDELSHQKRYYYDAFQRLVKVEELNASQQVYATTQYSYDVLSNLTQVVDNSSNTTTISYDWLSRKTTMTDPDMGSWSYSYDDNGNLTSQTDAKSQTITFTYDALNRLTGKSYPQGSGMTNVTYTYDSTTSGNYGKGQRTGMTDALGTTSYKYDYHGRLLEEKRTVDSVDYTTQFAYDGADRVTTTTYPTGEVVTNGYNGRGLPYTLSGGVAGNLVTGTLYNNLGSITEINLGNGLRTTFGYWDVGGSYDTSGGYYGRLWEIKTLPQAGGTAIQDVRHTWDAGGSLTQRQDALAAETESFSYDFLDRLTSVSGPYSESYAYNQIGNITSKNGTSYTYGTKPHAVTAVGATSYAYDANGNMITRGSQTLTWDYDNRPVSITDGGNTSTFVYDGDGKRVKKTENGETILYINKYYEKNLTTSEVTTSYCLGTRLIAQRKGTTLSYIHQDHLTGTAVTSNSGGVQTSAIKFYPFGATRSTSGSVPTDKKFTGQRLDGTGLYYYGARYYDANIGRFISADTFVQWSSGFNVISYPLTVNVIPQGLGSIRASQGSYPLPILAAPGSMPQGSYLLAILSAPMNPQTLNRYSYVLNNPLRYTDPTGCINWGIVAAVAIGVVVVGILTAVSFGVVGAVAAFVVGFSIGTLVDFTLATQGKNMYEDNPTTFFEPEPTPPPKPYTPPSEPEWHARPEPEWHSRPDSSTPQLPGSKATADYSGTEGYIQAWAYQQTATFAAAAAAASAASGIPAGRYYWIY